MKSINYQGKNRSLLVQFAAILCTLLLPFAGAAQHKAALQLQEKLINAIGLAQPACVRMWGFDTLLNQRTSAQFSGVVVKGGYILTAAHVVTPANTYKVMFPDGRNCIATALGKIEFSEDKTRPDVALMKIDTKGVWPSAEMGFSGALQAFDPCISVAYPESLDQSQPTLRFGYVTNPLVERGFIKSTCIMEPGDSGGPLFDIQGRVIGIHSAIEIPENDNYDVPVDLYRNYWTALLTATTYHALPKQETSIVNFNDSRSNFAIPMLKDMVIFTGLSNLDPKACVSIESIMGGGLQKILGTVISLRGTAIADKFSASVIVSKNSMVGDSGIVISYHSKRIALNVVFRDKATDLVLLKPAERIAGGIEFKQLNNNTLKNSKQGSFLISTQIDTAAIVSVLGTNEFNLPKVTGAGFLGATAARSSKPAKVYFVRPGSPAFKNDIREGDVVTKVNGTDVDSAGSYTATLSKLWPGDTVNIRIKRKDENISKSVLLTYPPQIKHDHPAENFAGGKSRRRDGFTGVYSDDAIIKPEQCGGPVFNLDGNFCGIHIARFSRANSLLLGSSQLQTLINNAYKAVKIK